jgi:tripartite-type tricarboxylate transporter receptor subunit TctC
MFHSVSSAAANPALYKNLSYDPVNSFAPISLMSEYPLVMIINQGVPARDLKEFIALLKANPGRFSYGSSGVGSGIHLAAELFKRMAGVDITHIPYKGTSPSTIDLLAGRIEMTLAAVPSAIESIRQGQVRALAVTSLTRSPGLPDVPTIDETLKGYELPYWNALYAPVGTPKSIIDRLAIACAKVMRDPEVVERLRQMGAESIGSTPERLNQFWKEQLALYRHIADLAKVQLDAK